MLTLAKKSPYALSLSTRRSLRLRRVTASAALRTCARRVTTRQLHRLPRATVHAQYAPPATCARVRRRPRCHVRSRSTRTRLDSRLASSVLNAWALAARILRVTFASVVVAPARVCAKHAMQESEQQTVLRAQLVHRANLKWVMCAVTRALLVVSQRRVRQHARIVRSANTSRTTAQTSAKIAEFQVALAMLTRRG